MKSSPREHLFFGSTSLTLLLGWALFAALRLVAGECSSITFFITFFLCFCCSLHAPTTTTTTTIIVHKLPPYGTWCSLALWKLILLVMMMISILAKSHHQQHVLYLMSNDNLSRLSCWWLFHPCLSYSFALKLIRLNALLKRPPFALSCTVALDCFPSGDPWRY